MNSPYGVAPNAYGPPPAPYGQQAYGPPPAYGAYATPPQMAYGPAKSPKSSGAAVAFELLGGTFLQTFGIGHLYAGNVGTGLAWMFGYWAVTFVNFLLCFVLVGFVTWPLCWIAAMIVSSITASNAAKRANADAGLPNYG